MQKEIVISGCSFDVCFKTVEYRVILVYRPSMLFSPKVDQDHKMQAVTYILSSLSTIEDTTFILGDLHLPSIDLINPVQNKT